LVAMVSNTNVSTPVVYVRLLGEGTVVFRPVPARKVADSIYLLQGEDIFSSDEDWEFAPGTTVNVEARVLSRDPVPVLVAISKA
jgi:hypothetical protein